jgi:cell wall assembly regulator SMI1
MDSISLLWQRIEHWLSIYVPEIIVELRPGASEEELAQAETTLDVALPEEMKTLYRLHNGSERARMGNTHPLFLALFSLDWIVDIWNEHKKNIQQGFWDEEESVEVSGPIQGVFWHSKWIPLAADDTGGYWCVDLDPPAGGTVGQIIGWDHEGGPYGPLFANLDDWLSTAAGTLEAGLYIGPSPIIPVDRQPELRASLQERGILFQQLSPAKPLLTKAMVHAWNHRIDESLALLTQVLHTEAATPEDRFHAYAALVDRHMSSVGGQRQARILFAQWEAEANLMPATHWVHQDLKAWRFFVQSF